MFQKLDNILLNKNVRTFRNFRLFFGNWNFGAHLCSVGNKTIIFVDKFLLECSVTKVIC